MDAKLRLLRKLAEDDPSLWSAYATALERKLNSEEVSREEVSIYLVITLVEGMLGDSGVAPGERLEAYLVQKQALESRKNHILRALREINNDEPELVTQLDIRTAEADPDFLEALYRRTLFPVRQVLIVNLKISS